MIERETRLRLSMLSREDKESIHAAALRLLGEVGMRILHEEARALLEGAGCAVDGDRVRFDGELVESAIASAPASVVVYDREGEPAMDLGGFRAYFGTGSDLIYTVDGETLERRHCVLEDVRKAARLCDALENIDFVMSLAYPSDVPAERGYAEAFRAMVENTTKPLVCTADGAGDLVEMWEMGCAIAGGESALRDKPYFVHYAEPISPLTHPRSSVDKVLLCAQKGIPLVYSPAPMAGATAPITMAGHVAQGLAECLAGMVMHQVANEGAPFIMGMGPAVLDMATSQSCYNAPEYYLSYVAMIEMAHFYDRPSWGYAGTSDAQIPDEQAALEATTITLLSSMLGSNLNHDVGYVDCGRTASLEMVVIMDEIIGQLRRVGRGVPVNKAHLALETIREVGPQGHFLDCDHTVEHFRDVQWRPKLLSRAGREEWEAAGSTTLRQRARARLEEILGSHEPVTFPGDVASAIREVAERGLSRSAAP